MSINIRIPATPETYSVIKNKNLTNRHVKMGVKVQLDILLLLSDDGHYPMFDLYNSMQRMVRDEKGS